jgi:hypothetical protein
MRVFITAVSAFAALMVVMTIANIVPRILFPRPSIQQVSLVPPDFDALRVRGTNAFSVVSQGGNTEELTNHLKRLKAISAGPGETAKYNHALNVVVLAARERSTPPGGEPRKVALDLAGAGDAGFLLMSDEPTIWTVRNPPSGARAKIAVESEAAFDIEDAPAGLLAGFRVAAFGASGVARPADYINGQGTPAFRRFCAAIATWANFFNVPFKDVRFWQYGQTSELDLRATQVSARGQEALWARSIAMECDPPPPTPQTVFAPLPRVQRRIVRY